MPTPFTFGKNWRAFIERYYSEERAASAANNLLASLKIISLRGMTFLDIGCGSGLHSLAAWRAGAEQVTSFDYDQNSVAATRALWHMAGEPKNWCVMQGSVLDSAFIQSLGVFDIVYSWGVLHHTGDMWQAIRNARLPLADSGVFFIALYSDSSYRDASYHGRPTPEEWLRIKQKYNAASELGKRCMEYAYVWRDYFSHAFPHPVRTAQAAANLWRNIQGYKQSRGMEFWTDIRDWLGGWPMDFVREQNYIRLCLDELGLEALQINSGEGNTEFLFRPVGCSNYWNATLADRKYLSLPKDIIHEGGFMYRVAMPHLVHTSDTPEFERRSTLTLFEEGVPLGYRHAQKVGIEHAGGGRYLHWKDMLYFAASDGSNPQSNGKVYTYCM